MSKQQPREEGLEAGTLWSFRKQEIPDTDQIPNCGLLEVR